MASEIYELSLNLINKIMHETKQTPRPCQLKDSGVHARILPAGYVLINAITQPESYKLAMQVMKSPCFLGKVAPQSLADALQRTGFYITNGNEVVICGTQGEFTAISPAQFSQFYRLDSTIPQMSVQQYLATNWQRVIRKGEPTPHSVGICIPAKYVIKLPNRTVVNHPEAQNHGKGDILVAPIAAMKSNNGTATFSGDFSHAVAVNNAVFSNTYNLTVGGWGASGLIIRSAATLPLTTDKVRRLFAL